MTEIADLEALVELAVKKGAGTFDRLRSVITKELLHYDILYALESNGLLRTQPHGHTHCFFFVAPLLWMKATQPSQPKAQYPAYPQSA